MISVQQLENICNNLLFIMRLKCIFLLKQFLQSRANKIYIFERFHQGTDKGNVTMRESDVCRKTVKTLFNLRIRQLERFGWCWQVHNPLVVTRYNGCPGETLRWLGAAVRWEHHQPCTGETLFIYTNMLTLVVKKYPGCISSICQHS